jgi:hypothetical protein
LLPTVFFDKPGLRCLPCLLLLDKALAINKKEISMNLYPFSTLAILFLATSVSAQQAPGAFSSDHRSGYSESSERTVDQAPGHFGRDGMVPGQALHHSGNPSIEPETPRLESLLRAQEKKNQLLEEKIKLLEAELENERRMKR